MEREYVVIEKAWLAWGNGDYPPTNAAKFVSWFAAKFAEIPKESRADAEFFLRNEDEYVTIELAYTRPETDEEFEARKAGVDEKTLELRARELAELARLRAKYGNAT